MQQPLQLLHHTFHQGSFDEPAPPGDVEEEFRRLLGGGYREFNLIGQDITSYGRDKGSISKGSSRDCSR